MATPVQLDLFQEPKYEPFMCYVTKVLYDDFVTFYGSFCVDIQRFDVGMFYQVELMTSDVFKAEINKARFFKF